MSNEPQNVQTANSPRRAVGSYSPARFALIFGLIVVSLPFLMMSIMMVGMGWMGSPMHGGMAGPITGFFPIVGFLTFVVFVGVLYGVYRVSAIAAAQT